MKPIDKRGFTLIELLIVIAIIGLISTIVSFSFQESRRKSRDTKRVADLALIQKALELGFNQGNGYPVVAIASKINLGSADYDALCGKGSSIAFVADTSVTNCDADKVYMGLVPNDPLSTTQEYVYQGTASTFCTAVELEGGFRDFSAGSLIADEASLRNGTCPSS